MRLVIALWLAVVVVVAAAPAWAGSAVDAVEAAEVRYRRGEALFAEGRFADALAEFEAARQLVPRPQLDYNIGLCLDRLGRPAEAAAALRRYLGAVPDDADAAKIRTLIAELDRRAAPAVVAPAPPPPFVATPRGRATVALAVFSGATLVTGVVLGSLVLARRDDAALWDENHAMAIATDVLLPVGAVAAVTAIVLGATRPRAATRMARWAAGGLRF
jgi:tetratricopeptide (TPR) repeat protein